MSKNNMFNQKLEQIGGENIVDGITLKSEDKEKILNFINANTNQNYILNDNKLEKEKTEQEIKNTLLDEEIDCAIKENRKILIALSENVENVIEMYISEDNTERIILIDKDFCEKDNLEDIALADRLTKALFITHENDGIALLSSTAIKAVIGTSSNVYHGPDSSNYAKVGSIDAGEDPVYILATSMGWYHIEYLVTSTGKHKSGYIPASVVSSYSGGTPNEEDFYGGYCYATTELDVRTCDDFNLTAPVGTLFKHEGCTMIFHYDFVDGDRTYHVAFIEYSTSSGVKRGYVYNKYLSFPCETCVAVMNEKATVYAGPNSGFASIGSISKGEFISIIAKESNDIYVEYNTTNGRKRGYIKYSQVTPYHRPAVFPDFYTNGTQSHIVDERVVVYGGPNSNYAELGAVRNEDVTCFNTNKTNTDEYTFEYTCIEYTVGTTGQRKRGYVLASKVIVGNLPEENNSIENFDNKYSNFGTRIIYGQTQKGRNMSYYKCGFGPNKLFLVFAQHGWEDGVKADGTYYHGDGNMLLKIAKNFMTRFAKLNSTRIEQITRKWTIYLFPGINLDGIINGNTNDGFGRCFYNGIDANRSWPGDFKIFNNSRNKTGNSYLGAKELQQLKDTLVKLRGNTYSGISGPKTVLLDIHGWENSFLSNSTELANYYLSEMKNINSAFRYKDTTGSTTINGFLMKWAHNAITMGTSSTDMAGLGATTGLLELPPTTDYSDNNILNNYGLRFFNGTINLLENMSVSTEADLSVLSNSLEKLYNLATSYSESKGNNISITEKNHLVLQYLRRKKYSGLLWNTVAGLINDEFNAYVYNNAPELEQQFLTIPIPGYRNIAIEHWAATLDSCVQSSIFDSEANDLSGWAGDLLQLGAKLEAYNCNASENDVYNLIGGTDDGLAINLGAPSVGALGFDYEDWVSDVDAVCISIQAKSDVPIHQAVKNYYSNVNNRYLKRYKTFIDTILGGTVPNLKTGLTALVSKYTETKTATSILFAKEFKYNKVYSSKLTNQLVNKLLELYIY